MSRFSLLQFQKSRTIEDIPFSENIEELQKQVERVNTMDFAVLDDTAAADMKAMIEEAANEGDSVGGILESCILNVPAGLGELRFAGKHTESSVIQCSSGKGN